MQDNVINSLESTNSNVKVSVVMLAYNHEKYIAQAIESVLMQETDFNYDIVIGEDGSTDRTQEIVIEYKKKYPDKRQNIIYLDEQTLKRG